MMLLIYYNILEEKTYQYIYTFDISRVLGEKNVFGDVLVGLYVYDLLENKIIPYRSSSIALLDTYIRYEKIKD